MALTQDEIKNTLQILVDENILEKPILFSGNSIYLAADIRLYDLLSEYSSLYYICRSTLNKLWNLRPPTPEEIEWLQRIESNSKVETFIANANERRKKKKYYERQKLITDLIRKTSGMEDGTEKEFQEMLSGSPKYQFIDEIRKFAVPNWFQTIRKIIR
jgi:hypothetical protein